MSKYVHRNDVLCELTSSITGSSTSITVNDPSAPFRKFPTPGGSEIGTATLTDNPFVPSKKEIITYSGVTDNGNGTHTLTGVVRAREGTTAQSFSAGESAYQAPTPGSMPAISLSESIVNQLNNLGSVTISATQWGYLGGATSLGGTMMQLANAAAGRTALVLGTAATADVQTSPTDTTDGRLMAKGAFGWGSENTVSGADGGDLSLGLTQASFNVNTTVAGISWPVVVNFARTSNRNFQFYLPTLGTGSPEVGFRYQGTGDVISDIYKFHHTGNLPDPATLSGDQTFTGANTFNSLMRFSGANLGLRALNGNSQTIFNVIDFPELTNADALVRFFRTTNTSGLRYVDFHVGNGTPTTSTRIRVDGNSSFFNANGGNVGIGTTSPTEKADINGRARADQFVVDAVTAIGNITGSTTINLGTSNILSGTVTGNATLSFTAPPGPCTIQILLTNSGAGNTITLPGSVVFVSGAQTEDDGAKYVLSLVFDGSNYWASWAT